MKKLTKLNLSIIILFYLLVSIFIAFSIFKKNQNSLKENLINTTKFALESLNKEDLLTLSNSSEDIYLNEYQDLKNTMIRVGETVKFLGIKWIYIISKKEEKIYFNVDSALINDPGYSPPGTLYEKAPKEIDEAYNKQSPVFAGPYNDEYGRFYSVFVPIKYNNKIIGILASDIEEKYFINQLIKEELFPISMLLITFLVLFYVYLKGIFRLKEEQVIRKIEERYREIIESSDDGILSETLDGIITTWNKGAENVYGYKAEDIIGKSMNLVIPKELQQETRDLLVKISKGERISHFETKRLKKDGKIINIFLTLSPIINEDNIIVGASAIARDVTEKKHTEEILMEKLKDLERLNKLMVNREIKMIELKKLLKDKQR